MLFSLNILKVYTLYITDLPISRKSIASSKKTQSEKKGETQISSSKKSDTNTLNTTVNGGGKSASSTSSQKPKKKKTRTTFTAYQLEELERAFERAPYPGKYEHLLSLLTSCT